MRRAVSLLVVAAALLALAGCRREPTGPRSGDLTEGTLGRNLLVQASGELAYKRPGWKEYLPLSFGIALARGDLLQVASDGSGLLVCADLSLATLEAGYLGGLPCRDENAVLTRGDSLVIAPQRDAAARTGIPILLQPRHTFLRGGAPLIRWTASGPAGGLYTVRVWGVGLDWEAQTTATELRYPEDAPALEAGIPYHISIADADGASSDQEATALDLGFALLSADQAAAVDALLAQAGALGVDPEGKRLVEAEVLASQGLRMDAIAVLVELAAQLGAPSVHQRLGELYLEVGLYSQAGRSFEAALDGFRSAGHPAGEAEALLGLGLALRGDNDPAAARAGLDQALGLFGDLGDAAGAARAQEVLTDLGE